MEIGVSAGGSSAIILNAIKNIEGAKLYSIDYLDNWYKDKDKLIGWAVKEYTPELIDKWMLYTDGLACKFIEKIGEDIDFCFIDTVHSNPGEILDFLMILPYLKKNAVVVFHDTCLHTHKSQTTDKAITNCILMSAIKGEKLLPKNQDCRLNSFPNIGGIILADDIRDCVFDIFNALKLPWFYCLNETDYNLVLSHFSKHYDKYFVSVFEKARKYYSEKLKIQSKNDLKRKLHSLYKRLKLMAKI